MVEQSNQLVSKQVIKNKASTLTTAQKSEKVSFKEKISKIFNAHKTKKVNKEYADYAIYIKDFTKKFKKFVAVDNATIKVKKGTIHGFIGPNGSGKTTTIKCLISAMIPTSGQLLVHGQDSWTVAAKKHIGYIPEAARFPKRISTYDYLVSMGEVSGLSTKQAKKKSEEILKDLNLWKFKKRNPNAYSSGMKKKVLLAQSLLNNPDILILDEPAANLDPTARTELFNDLRKLRKQGKSVLISSHILSELQALADEVTILNYSKVVYHGSVKQDKAKYELNTSDNAKLIKLLEAKEFQVEKYEKHLLVDIKKDEEINQVISIALKAKITIKLLKPYILDLQSMYEKIVMENNPNKPQKKGKQ
ncbi:ABC transporter ATP-binding protein [Spiroplasma platyhelix]|uniref:ABC transporter ATP-binding protein n=1 Tax=Spiroplasma platyhelix PALS-1 TaxID=1276218 RepID=A0A846TWA5_9MOLU|nr:ABC transporter ATP-binding protein [Spiroplasma platyhelix]MBE4704082.1 Vitamin B12 import ATP-binding protein BtuD [Spiroplasma platyhelix PALS-1]NKE38452.1 ABC transporter ATP-binding protein [Spiroplasma platyhelix PALS-1]UJB29340.1 ABC transporter ATP-binding protein [Spiroplasma platyhelix PALS-1]